MTTARRRVLEEKKTKSPNDKEQSYISKNEKSQDNIFISYTTQLIKLIPSFDLLEFWFLSAVESSLFYLYITLFTPLQKFLFFSNQGRIKIFSACHLITHSFKINEYVQLDSYYQIISQWLQRWDISNQTRITGFLSSFIYGYLFYCGYEICPTYTMINYSLGKYPNISIMLMNIISSCLGGALGGFLLKYLVLELNYIPSTIISGLTPKNYTNLNSFLGELLLSFIYSFGVNIVCRTGSKIYGVAEVSWFINSNLSLIASTLNSPGNLSLTYTVFYGVFSNDYSSMIVLGLANVFGTLFVILLNIYREKRKVKGKQTSCGRNRKKK